MASQLPTPNEYVDFAKDLLARLQDATKRQDEFEKSLAAAKEELLRAQETVLLCQDKVSQLTLNAAGAKVNLGNLIHEVTMGKRVALIRMPERLESGEEPSAKRLRPTHKGVAQLETYTHHRFVTWPDVCKLFARLLRSPNSREQVSPAEHEVARKYCALPSGDDSNAFFDIYDDGSSPVTVAILPALLSDLPDSLVHTIKTDKRGY